MMMSEHPSYQYAYKVCKKKIKAPKYVKKQCKIFISICDGKDKKYFIDEKKVKTIDKIAKMLKMAKGLCAGESIYNSLAGYQWLFVIATLCVVFRNEPKIRRYQNAVLEIARKNGKTFIVAFLFLLLFFFLAKKKRREKLSGEQCSPLQYARQTP